MGTSARGIWLTANSLLHLNTHRAGKLSRSMMLLKLANGLQQTSGPVRYLQKKFWTKTEFCTSAASHIVASKVETIRQLLSFRQIRLHARHQPIVNVHGHRI